MLKENRGSKRQHMYPRGGGGVCVAHIGYRCTLAVKKLSKYVDVSSSFFQDCSTAMLYTHGQRIHSTVENQCL